MKLRLFAAVGALLLISSSSIADTISVGTYNIEHWNDNFAGFHLGAATRRAASQPGAAQSDEKMNDMIAEERRQNDEDHWEVARVILDPNFNPDILVIQEGAGQKDLEYFNKRWLNDAYATVVQFQSNTDRYQHLGMLLKPGFTIVEKRDTYRDDKDTVPNPRGNKLFARGPAFALIETPTGYRFWVGVTHQKSKSGNNLEVTQWRNRESVRTHEIMKELAKEGPDDVILLGDMNDEVGTDKFESEPGSGGDAMANLVGPKEDNFILVTQPLVDAGAISFGGYWRPEYRSLIDHAIATPGMKGQVVEVKVIQSDIATVASDHYPVLVKLRAEVPASTQKLPAAAPPLPVPTTDDRQ